MRTIRSSLGTSRLITRYPIPPTLIEEEVNTEKDSESSRQRGVVMSNETGASAVDLSTLASPASNLSYSETGQEGDDGLQPMTRERTSSVSDEYLRYLSRPGHIEKRFPIDRKKLERLIIAGGKDNESAEDFFKRVMEETGTLILWPSKLKIGAKSKKDPQVKVVGLPQGVQQARELVLADLDAKSSRITLKVDVPFAEHSHVIGKEGANIKKVHEETNCHIHFPDSNRSLHSDKSNQVSITGSTNGVELARKRIRELLPVVVTFPLPMPGNIRVDQNSPDLQQMMFTYNVSIHIKPQPREYSMLIVVKGTMKFLSGLKLAVTKIVEYFTGDYRYVPPVSLNLDIAPQHHKTLIGSGGGNHRKIMQDTGTTIQFPDPQSRYQSCQVTVSGTIEAVFKAREQLMGCLPVVLMFDAHETEGSNFSSSLIGELMQQLDVYISVKPKQRQPVQSVIIKSIEQNMQCMYYARMKLLEQSYQPSRRQNSSSPVHLGESRLSPVPSSKLRFQSTTPSPLPDRGLSPVAVAIATPQEPDVQESANLEPEDVTFLTQPMKKQPPPETTETSLTGSEPDSDDRKTPEVRVEIQEMSPEPPREQNGEVKEKSSPPHKPINPPKLTTKSFLDYDRKREEAQKAKTTKVEPNEKRYPTTKWVGNYFSESMPSGGDSPTSPTSTATPQGLSSINRTGFQALVRQASIERQNTLLAEKDTYRDISDVSNLLQRLGLEKYQSCFDEEEVDFPTFLTMTESDFKEIGISTLGARRKLQLAISELKKIRGKPSPGGVSTTLPRAHYSPQPLTASLNKSTSLKRGSFSKSVRF